MVLLLLAPEVGSVHLSYSVLSSLCVGLFILVAVASLCGTVFGWKASSYYKRKHFKSDKSVLDDKSIKPQASTVVAMKITEDTATYDDIVNIDNSNVKLCKNIAYGPLSLATSPKW